MLYCPILVTAGRAMCSEKGALLREITIWVKKGSRSKRHIATVVVRRRPLLSFLGVTAVVVVIVVNVPYTT